MGHFNQLPEKQFIFFYLFYFFWGGGGAFLKKIRCFIFWDFELRWKLKMRCGKIWNIILLGQNIMSIHLPIFTASNLCLLLQKEQNVKGGEGPSGKQAVGINNGTR